MGYTLYIVLATGTGNPPAVQVWTAKTGRFGSRTVQKPDPQTLGGPNPDPYPSTHGFRQVWLDLSVRISCSAFRVSHLWSHSYVRLLIVQYWPWYVTVRFRSISRLDVHNKNTQAPNYIMKMSVKQSVNDIWSYIFGNMRGAWLQTSIKKDMRAFIGIWVWGILATSSGTVTTYFIDRATTKYSWDF